MAGPRLAMLALLLAPGLAAATPAWVASDVGAPYVVLLEQEDGEAEVGTLQFLIIEDRGETLRVRVRSSDEALGRLFGAGDYVVRPASGQVVEAAEGSAAAPGQHLGWWLEPGPPGNGTFEVLGHDLAVRGEEVHHDRRVTVAAGERPWTVGRATREVEVTRFYRVDDGLLQSVEVRRVDRPGDPVPWLRVDLAAEGPVRGAVPAVLVGLAALGPVSFAAAFGAMLLARWRHGAPPPARTARFCPHCGAPAGPAPLCARCRRPLGVGP